MLCTSSPLLKVKAIVLLLIIIRVLFCCHCSKLTQHNEHRVVVMEHMSPALPAFTGLLSEHMNNPVSVCVRTVCISTKLV